MGVIGLILLSACGNNTINENTSESSEITTEQQGTEDKEESESVDPSEQEEEESEKNNTQEEMETDQGVEQILRKSAEAMETLSGMKVNGTINQTSDMGGTTEETTTTLNGEYSVTTSTHHYLTTVESNLDPTESIEMYISTEGMYLQPPEEESWLMMSANQGLSNMNLTLSSQPDHFLEFKDLLDLSETADHYVFTITGSGDSFKQFLYGNTKSFMTEEEYQNFLAQFKNVSGKYQFNIAKDTYYLTSLNSEIEESVILGGIQMDSTSSTSYEYSSFNEIEPVSIPDEIKNNAVSIQDQIQSAQ